MISTQYPAWKYMFQDIMTFPMSFNFRKCLYMYALGVPKPILQTGYELKIKSP